MNLHALPVEVAVSAAGFAEGIVVGVNGDAEHGVAAVMALTSVIEDKVIGPARSGGETLRDTAAAGIARGIQELVAILCRAVPVEAD